MNALRHLGDVLQEKWGIAPYPIDILEDSELMAGLQDEGELDNFFCFVTSARTRPEIQRSEGYRRQYLPPLRSEASRRSVCGVLARGLAGAAESSVFALPGNKIQGITAESFETLQSDSAEILFPISCTWMEGMRHYRRCDNFV